ncbi:MAG: IS66 family insertion sequence element accessory protein TnpB [Halioglobus sp.]
MAKPAHHAYLFANKRGNRVKILLHDGLGLWLLARRLNEGRFKWSRQGHDPATMSSADTQLQALLVGLPWQYSQSKRSLCCSYFPTERCRQRKHCTR